MEVPAHRAVALALAHAATASRAVDPDYPAIRDRMIDFLRAGDEIDLRRAMEPTPDDHKWQVGDLVEYTRSEDWAYSKGGYARVVRLSDECEDRRGNDYMVFWTTPCDAKGIPTSSSTFWTTPAAVRLVKPAADQ